MTAITVAALVAVGTAHLVAWMFRPRRYIDPVYEPYQHPTRRQRLFQPAVIASCAGPVAYIGYVGQIRVFESVATATLAWAATRLLVQRRAEP